MTATSIHQHSVSEADRNALSVISLALESLPPQATVHLVFTQPDGRRIEHELPSSVTQAVGDLVALLSARGEASVVNEEAEISPEDAATLLGISRPIVMLRIRNGDLSHRLVGTHHKLLLSEVLALREKEEGQRQALAEFGEMTDDMVAAHGP